MAKVKVKIIYPRNLYKKGGDIKWGSDTYYSTVLVHDDRGFDIAVKEGYIDDFSEALFGEEKEEIKEEEEIKEDDDF